MDKEIKTAGLMIGLYCRGKHGSKDNLCPECVRLIHYVKKRLEKCPFTGQKYACSVCPVHCYKPDMRKKIKTVMQYSGPRMIFRHPVLTAKHYLKSTSCRK